MSKSSSTKKRRLSDDEMQVDCEPHFMPTPKDQWVFDTPKKSSEKLATPQSKVSSAGSSAHSDKKSKRDKDKRRFRNLFGNCQAKDAMELEQDDATIGIKILEDEEDQQENMVTD